MKNNLAYHRSTSIPELLAPAGSKETLIAAIAAGADAVYLSGKQYGARSFAQNFDEKELCDAIRYAHLHGVRVYVTVNTLMHDVELPDIEAYLLFLAQVGVDAVIVQDIGVLLLACSIVPKLPVHASTQMSIHNAAGVIWAKKHGCSRVILARELSKYDISTIIGHPDLIDMGIEIFAHGALCFAYSGQCLLSSVTGGRSGNRGACAQPCRKRYRLVSADIDQWGRLCSIDEKMKADTYLLSTRDLCIYPMLDQILALPITSIKIEGRMRSPKYVATVVSIYRHALDALANESFVPSKEDELALRLAYSRDFTTGYGTDALPSSIMQPAYMNHPGNSGIYIGSIKKIDSKHVAYIKPEEFADYTSLKHGDGLSIFNAHKKYGTTLTTEPRIRNGLLELPVPPEAKPGDIVALTSRPEITDRYESLIAEHLEKPRHVNHIKAMITINSSGFIDVTATLISPHHTLSFSYQSDCKLLPAQKHELKEEDLKKQLQKTKNTPFEIISSITCPPGLFAPIKVQNEIRRELISHATEKLYLAYERPYSQFTEKKEYKSEIKTKYSHFGEKSHKKPRIIVLQSEYIPIASETVHTPTMQYISWYALRDSLQNDIEGSVDAEPLGVVLPIMTPDSTFELMEEDLALFTARGVMRYLVHTLGQADWIRSQVSLVEISGYLGLNITNSQSVSMLEGYSFLTLGGELSGEQIRKISRCSTVPLAVVVQGTMVIGVTKNVQFVPWNTAPAFALRDEKGHLFRILPDGMCDTLICNTDELTLIDYVSELVSFGIEYIIIDARARSPAYIQKLLSLYTDALAGADTALLKSSLQQIVSGRCTAAAWNRGL